MGQLKQCLGDVNLWALNLLLTTLVIYQPSLYCQLSPSLFAPQKIAADTTSWITVAATALQLCGLILVNSGCLVQPSQFCNSLSTQLAKPRPHYLSPLDAFSVLTVLFQVVPPLCTH